MYRSSPRVFYLAIELLCLPPSDACAYYCLHRTPRASIRRAYGSLCHRDCFINIRVSIVARLHAEIQNVGIDFFRANEDLTYNAFRSMRGAWEEAVVTGHLKDKND